MAGRYVTYKSIGHCEVRCHIYKFFTIASLSPLAIPAVMMLSTVIGVFKSAELIHPSVTGNLDKAPDQIT